MSTTVATLQATQPPPSPRMFYTTDDVKQAILTEWEAEEPFCLHFQVKSDSNTLAELEEMFTTLPCSKTMRTSYTVADGLVVRWMPGNAHDGASRAFIIFLHKTFSQCLRPGQMPDELFDSFGSSRHYIATPNKEWNEPDECFYPSGADAPSVVLEVGASEHLNELRSDACWWLNSFQVKLVIIIVIAPPPPDSPSNNPIIMVEHWQMVENIPTPLYARDWTDTVPNVGEYELPTAAFVPDDDTRAQYHLPPYISPKTSTMEKLWANIIKGWRLDVSARADQDA